MSVMDLSQFCRYLLYSKLFDSKPFFLKSADAFADKAPFYTFWFDDN